MQTNTQKKTSAANKAFMIMVTIIGVFISYQTIMDIVIS